MKKQTIGYAVVALVILGVIGWIIFHEAPSTGPEITPTKTTPHELVPVSPCNDGKCA